MTFRLRTALMVLVVTALTMGVAFALVWSTFVSSQRRQLDDALLAVAHREAAEAAAGQIEFGDAPGPTANAVGPLPKYGVLYGINGMPISSTENFTTIPSMPRLVPFETGFDFAHDGMPMRGVVVSVSKTGRRVLLATPRDDFEEDARILSRAMTVAFAVGSIWAALVAFGVATRLTREHRIIGAVARTVASGDPSARVSLRSSDRDLQQLADDINAMIERLVGLLAVQERFTAHAAHELRTPLAALRIELEHGLRGGRDPGTYEETLRGALDSARRLTDLAEDLLELARSKATSDEAKQTKLEDAFVDAVADVGPIGTGRGVVVVAEPLLAVVAGDRRSVARVLRNILENAVRFSPPDGRVRVASRLEGASAVLEVCDDGPGVGPGDEERIFEPFARGARSDDREGTGTGLGLSIARGLARSVGGDVSVGAGDGGRFLIRLPLAPRGSDPLTTREMASVPV